MLILSRLLQSLRVACAAFPDGRRADGLTYSMSDIGLSAFSLFFMQSESFLSHQRSLEEGSKTSNCHTLFGMSKIPTDNHVRAMLDPVHPRLLQGVFDEVVAVLADNDGLKQFRRLEGRTLIALDGTEYFCSQKLGCPSCQTRMRANGRTESYHSMLAATIVAPGHNMVVPLMPEFIVKPDGAEKQDCERNAAKRWLDTHSERVRALRPVYLGDDLFACQPVCQLVLDKQADFLFTAKPLSHKGLYDFMDGATPEERTIAAKQGTKKLSLRYRWFTDVPMREDKDALLVNWIGLAVSDAAGKPVYENAFITSLPVSAGNVADIAACARARWKIENGSFNVLKNNGYHLEHNFGHGKLHLAMMFAALNLLAFAFHTLCDCLEKTWADARAAKRSRVRFFEHLRTITAYMVFPSWHDLMTTLITSIPPPQNQQK